MFLAIFLKKNNYICGKFAYMATIINLPKVADPRGNLSFIEHGVRGVCPFEIERVYWIYDIPGGGERTGRALRHTTELIVPLSGSFDVELTDAEGKTEVTTLQRSDSGILVPPMTWRRIINCSGNAVALVLASTPYDPSDYIFEQ